MSSNPSITAAIVIVVGLIASATVASADAPAAVLSFRDTAYVKGPIVLLGEIADIEGDGADALEEVAIIPAAQPGASRRLDTALVLARLKSAGYASSDLQVKGAKAVETTTLHQEVTAEAIAQSLREYIEQAMPWDPLVTEVQVETPAQGVVAPEGDIAYQWKATPNYGFVGPASFRGTLSVDGVNVRSVTCKATVQTYANVVVATAAIPRGKPIAPASVARETRLLDELKEPAFEDPTELGNFTARAAIMPGQVITRSMVAPRVLVQRKQLVTVEIMSNGLQVSTQAEAQGNAAQGEPVQCVNPSSKQTFIGVVRADGTVVVQ